jgi:hypothetical protein
MLQTLEFGEKFKNIGKLSHETESNVLGLSFMALLTKYFVLTKQFLPSLL